MKHQIILVICLFCIISTSASSDTRFYNVNSMNGVSLRKITSICKDDNGFIWGCSKMGLLRVTEGDCRVYQLPYIATDIVSANLTYGKSGLYVYTNNGQLFRYDELCDNFSLVENLRDRIDDKYFNVHKIIAGDDGFLWLACTKGLYKIRYDSFSLIAEENNPVRNILFLDNNSLLYTTNNAVKRININTGAINVVYENETDMNASALLHDKKKIVYGSAHSLEDCILLI